MLTALLCAVAVAIGARGFAASQLDACAMLRVLGLSQRTIARTFMLEFFAVGLVGALLGILIGWSVHWVFVALLAGLVKTALPAASWWPALTGVGVGLSLMAAFGVAPILQLAKVPPLRVMRRDVGGLQPASFVLWLLGVVVFCGLLLGVSRDVQMGSLAVVGFAVSIGLFAGLTWLAVRLLRRTVNEQTAPRWMILATRQVAARPWGRCGAGERVSGGTVGPVYLGLAAYRSHRQLASSHAGRCPDTVRYQYPTRSSRGL